MFKAYEELECPFCGCKGFNKKSLHFCSCAKKHGIEYTDFKKEIRPLIILHNWPEFKDKEYFLKIYEKMSIPDFYKNYSRYFNPTILCNYYGIKPRNISEGQKNIGHKKYIKTCNEKIGKDNFLAKGTESYEKRNQTVKQKYNVDNVFQLDEIIKKIWADDNEKVLRKYGCSRKKQCKITAKQNWQKLSDKEREKWLLKSIWSNSPLGGFNRINGITSSQLEDTVAKWAIDNQFDIETQVKLNYDDNMKKKKRWFFYDILLKDLNVIIEVNGDFWHANPNKYLEDDILQIGSNRVSAKEIWQHDLLKKQVANDNGYIVIYIWEHEVNNNIVNNDNFKQIIEEKLNEYKASKINQESENKQQLKEI